MLNLLAQLRIGFFGLRGFLGLVLGLFLCCVVIWGIWKIFDILTTKFSNAERAWIFQIARVILIVFTVIWFVNAIFSMGWW